MTASFQDLGDRVVFSNDDGTYAIWKSLTYDAGGNCVGPGYIGRVTFRADGRKLLEGFTDPTLALNDTRQQGLGLVGWHHHRAVPNEPSIWNKSWNMDGHRDAAGATRGGFGVSASRVVVAPYVNAAGEVRASFEVDLVDPWTSAEGKRISLVRYDYIVDASQVKQWITWTQQPDGGDGGPLVFVKEPKVTFSMCPPSTGDVRLRYFDLYTDTGAALVTGLDMDTIGDPSKHTQQLGYNSRARARFSEVGAGFYWNIVGRANTALTYGADGKPTSYGTRANWEGAGFGMDQWAVNANSRAHFDDSVCPAYCLQGPPVGGQNTLTRQWELVKDPTLPSAEFHMHAWEGGYGTPDCLCCARAFQPGEKWTTFLSMSRDAGWQM